MGRQSFLFLVPIIVHLRLQKDRSGKRGHGNRKTLALDLLRLTGAWGLISYELKKGLCLGVQCPRSELEYYESNK